MISICAWCKVFQGEKEPLLDLSITHGICKPCADKIKAQYKMSGILEVRDIETITGVFDKK